MKTTPGKLYERVVFNRLLEMAADRPGVHRARAAALAAARGDILDLGTGTGLNLPNYPAGVRRVTATTLEPELDLRARRRAATVGIEVEHVHADVHRLPFSDRRFDTVVSSFLLCSVRDPLEVLREVARVLRPGGRLLFIEHIVAKPGPERLIQRLVDPVLTHITCGCSLLRDTGAAIASVLCIESIDEDYLPSMPLLYRRVIRGSAR